MNNKKILVSWVGGNDLKAVNNEEPGPILSTLEAIHFNQVSLLYNYPTTKVKTYLQYLSSRAEVEIDARKVKLETPIHFASIYHAASSLLDSLRGEGKVSVLLSPGTPVMQAVWILLGKTRYPEIVFYQSSLEQGVQLADIPFDISAEFIPLGHGPSDQQLHRLAAIQTPMDAAFNDIQTRNPRMQELKRQAQILARRDAPVLLYGETGTGKELFARAIHNVSNRAQAPFVALNCGAIPLELVDSVLFGHKKGAFTGAVSDRLGVFQEAQGGTLFLDEFGELEQAAQVRLLRVLQEGVISPIGSAKEVKVDVRLITATHRNLMEEVAAGRFREDLFYRVAVGVLHLPPLREREGDLTLLIDGMLKALNKEEGSENHKIISPDARNFMLKHAWRGNVRELQATILRAVLWSSTATITEEDIKRVLFELPDPHEGVMNMDISQGIDINMVISRVVSHYLARALDHTQQNKTQAARLLGLKNYQTLKNWMEKYGID